MTLALGPWIVAGMHRSGTSLIASALAAAGVDMGERLLAADDHNQPGYFEDIEFLDLDRRMLASACPPGSVGHPDWGWSEEERLEREVFARFRDEAEALVAARTAQGRPWGFKDPRAALLLDFWAALAPGARFLLVYRLPWEVSESMQRLGAEIFLRHPGWGYRVWSFYSRHLLDFHRRHRERSLLASVDAAVADPGRFASLLRDRLGLTAGDHVLAERFESRLLRRLPLGDPLPPLALATHPREAELLAALDEAASLPATGFWRRGTPHPPAVSEAPRVSVVIPCHDDGELLVEAVASVARVVDVPHEVLVVDDGSTEPRTREILDILAGTGYAIHRLAHGGLAAARNHGFAAARAPFVLPLDADNRLLPGFVAPALAVLEAEPRLAAVYGDRSEIGARNRRIEVGEYDLPRLASGNYIDACALVRREAWEECGGYDGEMPLQGWEDWDLWLTLAALGRPLRWLPLPAFEYRVRPGSMLHQLERSPERSRLTAYVVAKHHALVLDALRQAIASSRASRDEAHEMSEEQVAAHRELAAARDELAAARERLSALEEELRRTVEREVALGDELAGARRQALALHQRLGAWRGRLREIESTRAVAARRRVLRLRSRVERRPRTGPADPCAIGATGGSGTRVFARLAAAGGMAIGSERNEFEDALPIERFLDRWLVPYWQTGGGQPPHPAPPGMEEGFAAALAEQLAGTAPGGAPRGWKCPRSLYVLPFLSQRLPDLRFLHVVRDGRDMALSSNQLQLARYGGLLLPEEDRQRPEAERSILLWSLLNLWAADVGERLGGAYLRVRFEDLCAHPAAVTAQVFRFFDLPADPRRAARLVAPPPSIGRWRRADPALAERLVALGGEGLARFGYLAPESAPDRPIG